MRSNEGFIQLCAKGYMAISETRGVDLGAAQALRYFGPIHSQLVVTDDRDREKVEELYAVCNGRMPRFDVLGGKLWGGNGRVFVTLIEAEIVRWLRGVSLDQMHMQLAALHCFMCIDQGLHTQDGICEHPDIPPWQRGIVTDVASRLLPLLEEAGSVRRVAPDEEWEDDPPEFFSCSILSGWPCYADPDATPKVKAHCDAHDTGRIATATFGQLVRERAPDLLCPLVRLCLSREKDLADLRALGYGDALGLAPAAVQGTWTEEAWLIRGGLDWHAYITLGDDIERARKGDKKPWCCESSTHALEQYRLAVRRRDPWAQWYVRAPSPPTPAGYVYFIQAGEGGPIKIGWSASPQERLASLQTAHPHRLRLLHAMRTERAVEWRLHKELSPHRMEGEWFRPAPQVFAAMRAAGWPGQHG